MQQTRNDRLKSAGVQGLVEEPAPRDGHGPSGEVSERPILFVDVDGVISVFGFPQHEPPPMCRTCW